MNKRYMFFSLFSLIILRANTREIYPWAVVGAGPAGITAVSVLLENGVKPHEILWIDKEFKVGRLGKYYGNVLSNHQASRFTRYLTSCSIFKQIPSAAIQAVFDHDQEAEPHLQLIIDPMRDITAYFRSLVHSHEGCVRAVNRIENYWHMILGDVCFYANKVILAMGSYPKRFNYTGPVEIPLDLALDENKLKVMVSKDDTVMVVGTAQSAMLILKYLADIRIHKAINVCNKLLPLEIHRRLAGVPARWHQKFFTKDLPANIERILFGPGVIEAHKDACSKIIYAFGFQRNPLIVNGLTDYTFNGDTGIIEPSLFGIGIAFPRAIVSDHGEVAHLIGIMQFMDYAKELIPQWIKQ